MKTTLMVSTYYRYRTGVIQRILVGGDDGITESIPVNLATENDWGLESNVTSISQGLFKHGELLLQPPRKL